jgi:hypothetical protein
MVVVTLPTAVRTVTWLSTPSAPTIIITPASVTLGCNPSATDITAALGSATATAACSTPIVTFTDGPVQSSGCAFSQVRTFIASDGCGNSATAIRTVNWTVILLHQSSTATSTVTTLGCNPLASDIDAALGTATATDACSAVSITATDGAVATSSALLLKQEHSLLSMVVVTLQLHPGPLAGQVILYHR